MNIWPSDILYRKWKYTELVIYIRLQCLSTIISVMFATNNTATIAEKKSKKCSTTPLWL